MYDGGSPLGSRNQLRRSHVEYPALSPPNPRLRWRWRHCVSGIFVAPQMGHDQILSAPRHLGHPHTHPHP